nr:DNA mismatch repair protein MutS [uncultured Prevotella sp.]
MENQIKESYQHAVDKYAAEVAALKRKNTGFITSELLLFGAMATCLVCYFALDGDTHLWLCAALLSLVAYFLVRHFDDKNKKRIEHKTALMKVCQDEVKAMEGDFSSYEKGEAYLNPHHAYAFDLDIFGKDSLFNRICHTITTGGSDALAENLSRETPLSIDEIESRRELQQDLAESAHQWRLEFFTLGELNRMAQSQGLSSSSSHGKINSAAVVEAMAKVSQMSLPTWFGSSLALLVGWLFIIGICASVVLAILGKVSVDFPLWWVMIQFMVVFAVCKSSLDKIDCNGGKLRHQLMAYSQVLRLISQRTFSSQLGKEMQEKLAEALPSFSELEKILSGYDRRGNFLGLFFTDSFLLSDFFLVRRFLKWKNNYMAQMEEWVEIVSELDAMVSMADFRYNHHEATDARLLDASETQLQAGQKSESYGQPVVFEAKNLYHPFLGAKAVKNDFCIDDSNYYIVTGANMAGKSTFLRSLGINYILAMAGMPVFADTLRISRFRLFSSMRTSDDLTHGISYFNAELLRLEQLVQFCKGDALRTLIILDEILKGTNSVDKLNGSRLFLESIAHLPVSGVIATHDLELSKMENESDLGRRFHNYCFEIDLGLDVTYTYKIQRGVAKNQNATFLLKKLIEQNLHIDKVE